MDSSPPLEIKLDLDNSASQAAVEDSIQGYSRLEDIARASTQVQEDGFREVVRAVKEVTQAIQAQGRERGRARTESRQASEEERKQAKAEADAKKQADREAREAQKQAARETREAERQAQKQAIAAERAEAAEKKRLARETAATQRREERDRTAEEKRLAKERADADRQAQREAAEAAKKHADRSALAFAIYQKALDTALDTLRAFPQAYEAAGQAQKQYTEGFVSMRDQVRELANMKGQVPNTAFTLDFLRSAAQRGQTPQEAQSFEAAMMNSGAQFVGVGAGKHISAAENQKFTNLSAVLTQKFGLESEVAGEMAGRMLAYDNYNKFGGQGAEQALSHLYGVGKILQAGSGGNAVLGRQYTMTAAAYLNKDRSKGAFTTPEDVAIAISMMAESSPKEASTKIEAAYRGLHDYTGKAGPLLQKAGVTPNTPFLESFKKLAPVVEAESRKQGVPMQQFLRQYFPNVQTAEAISIGINQGIGNRVIASRRAEVAQEGTPAAALQAIENYKKERAFQERQIEAQGVFGAAERGAKTEEPYMLRRAAVNRLVKSGILNSSSQNISNYLGGTLSFGLLSNQQQKLIEREATKILNEQYKRHGASAAAYGTPTPKGWVDTLWQSGVHFAMPWTTLGGTNASGTGPELGGVFGADILSPEEQGRRYQLSINRARREFGFDPIAELTGAGGTTSRPGADNKAIVQAIDQVNQTLKSNKPKTPTTPTPQGGRVQVNR